MKVSSAYKMSHCNNPEGPKLVAVRCKAWVCGRSLAGIADSKPTGGMDVCLSVVIAEFCQVEVSTMGLSLVQRSPTDLGASLNVI